MAEERLSENLSEEETKAGADDRPESEAEAGNQAETGNGAGNNDRLEAQDADASLPRPRIMILKDGESLYKPGMKTYLAGETSKDGKKDQGIKDSKGKVIGGTFCTCNTVCTCNTQKVRSCSCNSQRSRGVCSCNPVH